MFNAAPNLSLVEQTIVDYVLQKSLDETVESIHLFASATHLDDDWLRQSYCRRYLAVVHARGMC
jgi:hypothetical protein